MYDTSEFRKGLKIELENHPYIIVDFQHVSPGKGSAFTRTKLKSLLTQNVVEKTFKSGDKVDVPDLVEKKMQFMYSDGEGHHFMEHETYEQIALSDEQVGEQKNYLQEGITVGLLYYNDRPITVDVPNFVVLKIVKTEPGIRGDTVSGGGKPATLETGAVVQVPMHLNEGDKIKVDTRDNRYVEKAN